MILNLFFIFNFGVNALPIISNTFDIQNSSVDLKEKAKNLNIKVPKDFNLTEIAKDLKKFGINNLKDDKHFEGLPLDRHGKVNPDFHKEIFLGNHELFESDIQHDKQKRNRKLEEIFNEADEDHDQLVSKEELLNYVFKNVQLHLKEAKEKNLQLFVILDTNQNGKITWQEYASLYVKFHHMNTTIMKDIDDIDFIQESFNEQLQQELFKIRYRWTEADNGGDNELNIDEFLEFRHPEIAGRSYKYIADDLISHMDLNDDQRLNETEFVFLPANPIDNDDIGKKEWAELDKKWSEQQRTEFHEMDEDNDGVLTRDELLKAFDPMNRKHIYIQINRLFSKVDDSPKDDSLSLSEIKKHADVFTDMRFLDTAKALHEEE